MINKLDYRRCTLCQGCINVCPKNCIELDYMNDACYYPTINKELCINCNLCERVCPILNPPKFNKPKMISYAAKNMNEDTRKTSSSGGLFSSISESILDKNGKVCGVSFDENIHAKYIMIDNKTDLIKLRGSKYAQSNANDIFNIVKLELNNRKQVLFSGCPCQVGGLRAFLGNEYENLFTVDFICHGIPSENIFEAYKRILEDRYNSKIVEFLFRDKSKGWHESSVKVTFENGKIYTECITEDMYMRGFLQSIYLKLSCYNCEFRGFKSGSDITLADYWGAEIEEKEIDDNKGLSLVIINSDKGEQLINSIKSKLFIKKTNFDRAIMYNQSLFKSSKVNINRDKFFEISESKGYKKAFEIYCKEKNTKKCIRILRKYLGKVKRTIIK